MAAAMMGTELTEGGRMTAPREARSAPGIAGGARGCRTFGGARARASAEPARALEVAGEADFMASIADAESAAAAGRVRRAAILSAGWRSRALGEWPRAREPRGGAAPCPRLRRRVSSLATPRAKM